jgi:hypothetical protein
MDSVELARDAVAGAVAVVGGLTTTALGAVEADAVGLVEVKLVDVELVDVELVVDELESSDPLAQARPVARSTAVTAAAAKGIRYLINDPPFGLEVSVRAPASEAPQPAVKEISSPSDIPEGLIGSGPAHVNIGDQLTLVPFGLEGVGDVVALEFNLDTLGILVHVL